MTGLELVRGLVSGIFVLGLAGSAGAQDVFELGKTPAQLFASDCAMCHKSPRGLSKAGGIFGLQGFLREHYTTSRETAGAIAAYLSAVDREATPPREHQRRATTRRAPKTDQKAGGKGAEAKPAEAKPADSKRDEPKPTAARPLTAPAESKSAGASTASEKRE